jgi:subtilase family serine protease
MKGCLLSMYRFKLTLLFCGAIFFLAIPAQASSNPIEKTYGFITSLKTKRVKPIKESKVIGFDIFLKPHHLSTEYKEAIAVNSPDSSEFKHFMTPDQFRNQFGQPRAVTTKWHYFLKKHHLKSFTTRNGLILHVKGKVKSINHLFRTNINNATYHHNPLQFGKKRPNFPIDLSKTVLTVLGITDYNKRNVSFDDSSNKINKSDASEPNAGRAIFAKNYHMNALYHNGLTGKGQSIGIICFGDLKRENAIHFWRSEHVNSDSQRLSVKRTFNTPRKNNDPNEDETTMDVEYAGLVAPQSNIKVYLGNQTSYVNTTQEFVDNYSAVFDENKVSATSCSWGFDSFMPFFVKEKVETPKYSQLLNIILAQGALQGISNFVASGDSGALSPEITGLYKNHLLLNWSLQSKDPISANPFITSTGGTMLPLTERLGKAFKYNLGKSIIRKERSDGLDFLWPAFQKHPNFLAKYPMLIGQQLISQGGSGGGFSSLYSTPQYQNNVPGINTFNARQYLSNVSQPTFNPPLIHGTNSGRNYPDVSGCDFSDNGYKMYQKEKHGNGWHGNGGTSIVAPQYAAVAAVINSAPNHSKMGFWNPQIYQLAQKSNSPFTPLNSTIDNSNLYYTGQPGTVYNQATGLGTTDFSKLFDVYQ